MSVKSAPYYWVECDLCGANSCEGSDYAAWAEDDQAIDYAVDAGWGVGGHGDAPDALGHVCDDCAERWKCPQCTDYRTGLDGPCRDESCGWKPRPAPGVAP